MTLPNFVDVHAHLNFAAFNKDRDEVMERTLKGRVSVINIGTQCETSRLAVLLSRQRNGFFASVGLHPTHTAAGHHDTEELGVESSPFISRVERFDALFYRSLATEEKVVAIGECGLDYYRLAEDTKRLQHEAFISQIDLANELGKPLMLHVRRAYRDALSVLREHASVGGNVHFFAGSWEEAREFLDLGFSLSFTGVITFTREYDQVIRNAPLDMILSETDCPYVAPEPYRGKRNEPLYVSEVAQAIAKIRRQDFRFVCTALVENARRIFMLVWD